MFGPVISASVAGCPSVPSSASLGTNRSRRMTSSTGWRPPSMRSTGSSTTSGRVQRSLAAVSASDATASSPATASAKRASAPSCAPASAQSSSKMARSRAIARDSADSTLSSNSLRSGVTYRSALRSVWRRVKAAGTLAACACVTSM